MQGDILALFENKPTNLIINGGFDYWQRKLVDATVTTGNYVADRFFFRKSVGTGTASREVDGNDKKLKFISNTADSGLLQVGQQIEFEMFKRFLGKKVTISVEARATDAQSESVQHELLIYFRNDVQDGDVKLGANSTSSESLAFDVTQTFEKKEFTFTIPADAKAMFVQYGIVSGSSHDAGTSGFELKKMMLNLGQKSAPFAYAGRNLFNELQLCQRYFEKSYEPDTPVATITNIGIVANDVSFAGAVGISLIFNYLTKRETPVVLIYNPFTGAVGSFNDQIGNVAKAGYSDFVSKDRSYAQTSAGYSGQVLLTAHFTIDAEL